MKLEDLDINTLQILCKKLIKNHKQKGGVDIQTESIKLGDEFKQRREAIATERAIAYYNDIIDEKVKEWEAQWIKEQRENLERVTERMKSQWDTLRSQNTELESTYKEYVNKLLAQIIEEKQEEKNDWINEKKRVLREQIINNEIRAERATGYRQPLLRQEEGDIEIPYIKE